MYRNINTRQKASNFSLGLQALPDEGAGVLGAHLPPLGVQSQALHLLCCKSTVWWERQYRDVAYHLKLLLGHVAAGDALNGEGGGAAEAQTHLAC